MLLETLIAQACISFSGAQLEACHNAIKAAAVQSGAEAEVSMVENKSAELALKTASSVTGKEVLAVASFTVKVVRDRALTIPVLKTPHGVVPSVTSSVSQDAGSLSFGWKF